MTEILSGVFILAGTIFILLSALGIIRMPDLYTRMSATTKASTLGIGLVLTGTVLFWQDAAITFRAAAIIIFLFLTAPVAAHIIGREAWSRGVKLWCRDESSGTCRKVRRREKKN